MRQTAWLQTRPTKADGDKTTTPEPTRLERLRAEGMAQPAMPPCTARYLVGYLYEVGPTMPTGAGDAPVPHSELAAWQANTGIRLTAWEARTLRRLSADYVAATDAARARNCPAPWQPPGTPLDRVVQANVQKNAFRALAQL